MTQTKFKKSWSAKDAAVHLLSRRDLGIWELEQKLLAKDFQVEDIKVAIDYCKSNGWMDDLRYAKSQVRQWVVRGYGELRVRQVLQHKNIDSVIIQQALEDEPLDWFELAKFASQKKFKGVIAKDNKEYAKQIRFLQYRGYRLDEIREAIIPPKNVSTHFEY